MEENILEAQGLTKHYSGFAMENFSLDIKKGAITGLIGENGAGKTTFLKLVLGICRREAGQVSFLGMDGNVNDDIGVVFDECRFHEFLKPRQIEKIMAGAFARWDKGAFYGYLERFGLNPATPVKNFSRGMKMKLSIAVALSHHPRLLLLDEATSGLDPVMRDEVLDLFLDFIQDDERSILFSSHITGDLEKVADYVAFIDGGRLILCGGKDDLLESHGVVRCAKDDFKALPKEYVPYYRSGGFNIEALTPDRQRLIRLYPQLVVDKATLDDIMLFHIKGERS